MDGSADVNEWSFGNRKFTIKNYLDIYFTSYLLHKMSARITHLMDWSHKGWTGHIRYGAWNLDALIKTLGRMWVDGLEVQELGNPSRLQVLSI